MNGRERGAIVIQHVTCRKPKTVATKCGSRTYHINQLPSKCTSRPASHKIQYESQIFTTVTTIDAARSTGTGELEGGA